MHSCLVPGCDEVGYDLSGSESALKKLSNHFGITEEGDGKEWVTEPTKQREGDQVLPDGDESLVDDQQLIIDDIEARRQVGIQRYGQGHRPFNGRDTLQDLYEEQLDLLVYLRSIKRMAEAAREELVEVVEEALARFQVDRYGVEIPELSKGDAAEVAVDRIMGYVAGQIIKKGDA